MRQELADANMTINRLQVDLQASRDRYSEVQEAVAACEALKELCRRLGVTEEELDRLNARGVRTETEILRQELDNIKEEVEWLEKERKHWMHKVRQQPLLDTTLRLKLGLNVDQLKQLDHIVEQMRDGNLIVEGTDDYREKYKKEVEERKREQEIFQRIVRQYLERPGSAARRPAADAPTDGDLKAIRDEILAVGGADNLKHTIAEQNELLRSQGHRIEELTRELQQRFHDIQRLETTRTQTEAERQQVIQERDQYRQVISSGIVDQSMDDVTVESPMRHSTSVSMRRQGSSTLFASSALESFKAVESMLREQLATKNRTIESLEAKLKDSAVAQEKGLHEIASLQESATVLEGDRARLAKALEDLSESHAQTTERCAEMERTNKDFEAVIKRPEFDHHRELLQKVILLRQRESKLLSRLRLTQAEKDGAVQQRTSLQQELEAALNLVKVSQGEPTKDGTSFTTVLPSASSRIREEMEMLHHFGQELEKVHGDVRTNADHQYAANLRKVEEHRAEERRDATLVSQLNSKKRELEMAQVTIANLQAQLNSYRSTLPDHLSEACVSTELESLRQKCNLYLKQVTDRDGDIAQLTADLESARSDLAEARRDSHVSTPADNVGTNPQSDPKLLTQRTAAVQQMEQEVSRVKSMNVGLLQSLIEAQSEKKALQAQLEGVQRHSQMLSDQISKAGGTATGGVSDLVSMALRDNTVLKQQLVLAQANAKKLRIQALTAEANCRVLANEANAYKIGAFRLFRNYVDDVSKMVTHARQSLRQNDGRLSLRMSTQLHEQVLQATQHADAIAEVNVRLNSENAELQQVNESLQHEVDLLRASGVEKHPEADRQLMVEIRTHSRKAQREAAEAEAEASFLRSKLKRQEDFTKSLINDISRLESEQGAIFGSQDVFLDKLQELRNSVVARAEQAPPATLVVNSASAGSHDDTAANEAIEGYQQAVARQQDLNRQCTELQRQLSLTKQQHVMSETRAGALKEELTRAEHRLVEATRTLEDERLKARMREERLIVAHKEQAAVSQRATEHNTECLKEIISSKEKTISQLHQQLATQRARHLESTLIDSSRMERLHEQLFRENNTMVERFKATIEQIGTDAVKQSSSHGDQQNDAAIRQVQFLTQEVLELRNQCKELKIRNSALEQQLDSQISRSQTAFQENLRGQPAGIQKAVANAEGSLLGITSDQAAAIEQLRRREQDLLQELHRQQHQSQELLQQVKRLEETSPEGVFGKHHGVEPSNSAPPYSLEEYHRMSHEVQRLRLRVGDLQTDLELARADASKHEDRKEILARESVEFKTKVEALSSDIQSQKSELAKAKELQRSNESLRADLQALTEQNQRLVSATAFLRQKMIEGAQEKSRTDQQANQEMAITQRVAAIQAESHEQLRQLQHRVDSMQKELSRRVQREEDLLTKTEEAKRSALLQREQVIERDGVIAQLRRQAASSKTETNKLEEQLKVTNEKLRGLGEELNALRKKDVPRTASRQEAHPSSSAKQTVAVQTVELSTVVPLTPAHSVNVSASVNQSISPPQPVPTPTTPATPATPDVNRQDRGVQCEIQEACRQATPKEDATKLREHVALAGSNIAKQLREKQVEQDAAMRALQAANKRLEQQLGEERSKLDDDERSRLLQQLSHLKDQVRELKAKHEQENAHHKKEILGFLEERRSARDHQHEIAKADTSVAVRNLRIANRNLQQQLDEGKAVLERERNHLHGQIKTLTQQLLESKKEIERMKSDLSRLSKGRRTHSSQIQASIGDTKGASPPKMPSADIDARSETAQPSEGPRATVQAPPSQVLASSADDKEKASLAAAIAINQGASISPQQMSAHKREIMILEQDNDRLRRELRVDKQAEIARLQQQIDRMVREHREELLAAGAGYSPQGALPAESSTRLREFEDKLLKSESTVLDLRFERESLLMRAERLQRHMDDLLHSIEEGAYKRGATHGLSETEARTKRGTTVATLEGVIDQMKRVITRLQKENSQLRDNAVHSSRYVEVVRENKMLRQREKELADSVHTLTVKVSQQDALLRPGGKAAEQSASLQRKLRAAQNAAEQYQMELNTLRAQLNAPSAAAAYAARTSSQQTDPSSEHRRQLPPPPTPNAAPYQLAYSFPSSNLRDLDGIDNHRYDHHHTSQHQPSAELPPNLAGMTAPYSPTHKDPLQENPGSPLRSGGAPSRMLA